MTRPAALLVVLCAVTFVRADVGPPPGRKVILATATVDALEDFSDCAFFEVAIYSTPGPPPHGGTSRSVTLHFFVNGSVVHGTGARRGSSTMYAVPRSVAERVPGWKQFADDAAAKAPPKHSTVSTTDETWFEIARSIKNGEVPGAAHVKFGGSEEVPTSDTRDQISVHYRVTRTPTGVAFVRPEVPEPSGAIGKCGNDGPSRTSKSIAEFGRSVPWRWVAAGGAASLAVALAGLWLVWRLARRA